MKPTINPRLPPLPQLQLSAKSTKNFDSSKPIIIEAVVVSTTPKASSASSNKALQQFITTLRLPNNHNPQTLELIADRAIAKGSQLLIKMNTEQIIQVLSIQQPKQQPLANTSDNQATTLKEQQVIDNLLRQALPLKQPIAKLLPLLTQLISTKPMASNPLPKPMQDAVNRLLNSFSGPETLQNAQGVKQAILNNGTFFEAKLANIIKLAGIANTGVKSSSLNQLVSQDIKAQLQHLIKLTDQLGQKNTDTTAKTSMPSILDTHKTAQQLLTANPLLLSQPLIMTGHNTVNHQSNDNLGMILKQLSRQLMSSLAQTQVSQTEALSSRGALQADSQPSINHWSLELPVFNGKQIDNVDLHISRDDKSNADNNKPSQWVIMLSFDLHSLGKLKVQLSVVEQSVAATIWSEAEKTHLTVKQHIEDLQNNFEKAGIHVERLKCLLGKPPEPKTSINKPLVDTHS